MIPKKIHYCWFGRAPLPDLAIRCIASWKQYLPSYEVVEWNEENFDIQSILYTKEAYENKKYAFVSDYARFWILYNYGGVYFDTDVELIRPMQELLDQGPFIGCEHDGKNFNDQDAEIACAPGLGLACPPGMSVYKDLLDFYSSLKFVKADGSYNLTTVVRYTTEILKKHGLKNIKGRQTVANLIVYPKEYFCPKSFETGEICVTENTYAIHHFAASWRPKFNLNRLISQIIGKRVTNLVKKLKNIWRA